MMEKARRFGLADLMILVAAVAVGIGLLRLSQRPIQDRWLLISSVFKPPERWRELCGRWLHQGLIVGLPFVASLTWAMTAIRLRSPRPRFRRMARQPGAVACVVGSLVSAALALEYGALRATGAEFLDGSSIYGELSNIMFAASAPPIGFAILGAWLTLFLTGRWRPERNWIDRSGRILGWSWIAAAGLVRVYAMLAT